MKIQMNIFVVNNNQDDQRLCATIPAWSIFSEEAPHSGIIATYSDADLLRNRIREANLGEAKIAELNQAIDAPYQRPNTVHSANPGQIFDETTIKLLLTDYKN